ncbi:hypothetical protein YC2023_082241 [Brassica napus]
MDLSLEPTMPKTPPLFIFESPYQVQVESFHLSSWTVNGNGLDMLPMAFFLQDDHERVENDQEQLLDAIDEHTFFLKRLNSQMNMKLLLGLEMAWEEGSHDHEPGQMHGKIRRSLRRANHKQGASLPWFELK